MRISWKKIFLVLADICILAYLGFAVTSWNTSTEKDGMCTKVEINIEDENENGFLKSAEVKNLLEKRHLYPLSKRLDEINIREIEEELSRTAFVKTAQCYVTKEGHVHISLTQRIPIIRVKAENGEDYYIDDNGGVMPNTQYTSDMIIVTGKVNRKFACSYLSIMARCIMDNDLWHNQIEQINVLPDQTIELVPRVGEHIINIGVLPQETNNDKQDKAITEFVNRQFHRLELFYKYGLSQAGWNKYSYISLEYDNQIICTHKEDDSKMSPISIAEKEEEADMEELPQAENTETASAETGKKEPATGTRNTDSKTEKKKQ